MTAVDAGFEGPTPENLEEAIRNQDLVFKDTFPGMLGVHIVSVTKDSATATLEVGPNVKHPGGYAHGGAIAGFGDTLAAWATFPSLKPGQSFTTIEFKANFITGVSDGTLFAESKVVHRGRRTVVIEITIKQKESLVALMIVTQAILGSANGSSSEVPPE
ncbi:MAG: PaaI family thioesterase [Actinomycetota bacterium]